MTLQPGDCHEEELMLLAEKAEKEALAKSESTTSTPQSSTEIYPTFNITDVIQLGQHIPLERDPLDRNETESVVVPTSTTTKKLKPTTSSTTEKSSSMTSRDSWKPIITSNITKPAEASISDIDERSLNLGERMPKKAKTEKRSFGEIGEDDLMNSVPVREDSSDIEEPITDDAITMDEAMDKLVTVQLFQYRLGDVFEKAEKYARFTLFPLLSEQISNIFSLEPTDDKELISTDSPIIIKSKTKSRKAMRKYDEDDVDVRSLQMMARINDNFKLKPIEKIFNNYEKKKEELTDKEKANIHIDLPTYRPDVSSEKVFIPIEREP